MNDEEHLLLVRTFFFLKEETKGLTSEGVVYQIDMTPKIDLIKLQGTKEIKYLQH